MLMTCLVSADFDNHARRSCYGLSERSQRAEPGLEAMFPTSVWEAKPSSEPSAQLPFAGVVGRFAGDGHVVDVALAEARR